MTNPKNENQIPELIARLRNALNTRTWVNLPEDIEQAANELERLDAQLAANQQLLHDTEQELQSWKEFHAYVNEAVGTYGSYKP